MDQLPAGASPGSAPGRRPGAGPHPGLLAALSFVIPVRIDSADRLWNLKTVLTFLGRHFDAAEVLVVEQSSEPQLAAFCATLPGVRHLPLGGSGRFSKSAAVNAGALASSRRLLCLYDADVLLAPQALDQALDCLLYRGWDLVVPYNRICLDVEGARRERLAALEDFQGLDRVRRMAAVQGLTEVSARFVEGGILVADRAVFLAAGGANRKMHSYGWEDTEMIARFGRLGFPVLFLADHSLLHLNHGRGEDSVQNPLSLENRDEYLRVRGMSGEALAAYVRRELQLVDGRLAPSLEALRARHGGGLALLRRRMAARWALLRVHLQAHGALAVLRRLTGKAFGKR